MKMSEMLTWRCVMDKTIADRLKEARNKVLRFEPKDEDLRRFYREGEQSIAI